MATNNADRRYRATTAPRPKAGMHIPIPHLRNNLEYAWNQADLSDGPDPSWTPQERQTVAEAYLRDAYGSSVPLGAVPTDHPHAVAPRLPEARR